MKHFISFNKRKGFFLTQGNASNELAAHQVNHELMNHGFIMNQELFNRVASLDKNELTDLYTDIKRGLERVVGGGGYEPIYKNFPQSVIALEDGEFYRNAVIHYMSAGTWRPEDAEYVNRIFMVEPTEYTELSLITESDFNSIFTDIIYSGKSISSFDKEIVDWFISNGATVEFGKITFKETASYIGKRYLESGAVNTLPTRDATQVLRIWAAYSGGDEGLKENTRFNNPNAHQRRVLLSTLDNAYNLEESFKVYREMWLRVLFYLHPMTRANKATYPNVAKFADRLRNNPKSLRTFNSYVEEKISNNDITVLELLSKRMGMYTRRLDHMVRLFGVDAVRHWISNGPSVANMVDAYNHFTNRDQEQSGRGATLAYQGRSEVVTYDALEALDSDVVAEIKELILSTLKEQKNEVLSDKRVYIDRSLYYRSLKVNNRASSLTLGNALGGSTERIPDSKYVRMYVHWEGRTDIDLSGMVITKDNEVIKIGWNGRHSYNKAVVYSGDNTGYSSKNAEYLDIDIDALPNAEWVITDAVIFSGPINYKGYNGKAKAGWMMIENPEANTHWQPKTLQNAMVLNSDGRRAYLSALHVPSRSIVFLDLSMGNNNITTSEDAVKMRMYLESFVSIDNGEEDINWERINQGHLINLISSNIVDSSENADIVFDENSTYEEIVKYL